MKRILHVDMDAFFASVEQRDHPEWRGKPVIVGAPPDARGVVSTCSYEARRFGVHSAMPSRTAYAHCPQGIFVAPRMRVYQTVSDEVFEILGHYSPFVEGVSVDEAFLDITGTVHLFGSPRKLGEQLRAEVRAKCRLTCSVGIATNRLLAKIASEEAKPDGLFEMPDDPAAVQAWLAPRPAKILWGVGKKTAEILERSGFRTCGDLQQADSRFLERKFGAAVAASIQAHAFGIDMTPVAIEPDVEKSVSREYTFAEDTSDRAVVRGRLLTLVTEVGRRFRAETRWACTAKLKLRNAAFETLTRQARFDLPARDDITFRHLVLDLFDRTWPEGTPRTVRLVGFGVTDFVDTSNDPQPSLFAVPQSAERLKRERLAAALDALSPKSLVVGL